MNREEPNRHDEADDTLVCEGSAEIVFLTEENGVPAKPMSETLKKRLEEKYGPRQLPPDAPPESK